MTRAAIVTICASFATSLALAQDISGNWLGTLTSARLGRLERIRVMVSKNRAGDLIGTMYVSYNAAILPGHSAVTAYPCRSVSLIGSQLNLAMKREGMPGDVMAFQGIVSQDGNSIVGWLQGLGHFDRLKLERSGRAHNSKAPPEKSAAPAPTPPEPAPEAAMLKPALTRAPNAESSALLARALEKLSGTNLRLLKYTCLETIDRSYYSEPTWEMGTDVMTEPPSCKQREFGKERQLILNAQDRLRLEVAVADHREIDSWASVDRFDSRSIDDLVLTGPTSTGGFGTGLIGIFENSGVQYTFLGKKTEGSRQVFEYAFDVPLNASHYFVKAGSDWRKTAYHGWFEIDSATAELTRLMSETADLAPDTNACWYRTTIDYHYIPVGEERFLIPFQSVLDVPSPDGTEGHSVTTFSACHEYAAESSLILDGRASVGAVNATPKTSAPLPPGITLSLALLNPIDTRTAAAGDAVSATVTKAVRAPGSREILAAGAIAHGRIVQMRHQIDSGQFLIAIRYTALEQNGAISPLSVRLVRELNAEEHSRNRFSTRGTEFSLPQPSPTGESGSWFMLPAASGNVVMAAGSESRWITVAK